MPVEEVVLLDGGLGMRSEIAGVREIPSVIMTRWRRGSMIIMISKQVDIEKYELGISMVILYNFLETGFEMDIGRA